MKDYTNLYEVRKKEYDYEDKRAKLLSKKFSRNPELERLKFQRNILNVFSSCVGSVALPSTIMTAISPNPYTIYLGATMGTLAVGITAFNTLGKDAFKRRRLIKEQKILKMVFYNKFKPDNKFIKRKEELKKLKVKKI